MALSVESVAELFGKKCVKAVANVKKLTQKKLQDPSSVFELDASGALTDAVKGDFGPLQAFAQGYIEQNSTALVLAGFSALQSHVRSWIAAMP